MSIFGKCIECDSIFKVKYNRYPSVFGVPKLSTMKIIAGLKFVTTLQIIFLKIGQKRTSSRNIKIVKTGLHSKLLIRERSTIKNYYVINYLI